MLAGMFAGFIYALLILLALGLAFFSYAPRRGRERAVKAILVSFAAVSIAVTLLIIGSLVFEAFVFFEKVPLYRFLFGTHWSPQSAKGDEVQLAFGAVPVFLGTLLVTFIAMLVAAPLGLLSAIYLSQYAKPSTRNALKPILEILAGIPTVVYGYFAAITFAPLLRDFGDVLGLSIATESALAAGLIMGVMIIPFVLSLSEDVLTAVPYAMREASLGLGATRAETITRVLVPAALPGIIGALLLAISRGIGETMIVVMAAGLAANLTVNPLESVTTVTVQIVTLLVGDQEFDSAKTLSAFALGLTLFAVTLLLNIIALAIVKKYREQYE